MTRARVLWLGWLLRYWLLDKYRRPIFAGVCAIAATAATGLALEFWRT